MSEQVRTETDGPRAPWRLRLVTGDERIAAVGCETAVFSQWYGNTAELLDAEYGPYDDQTVFLAVLDAGGEAVASARLICPGPRGLKTLVDLGRRPWCADVPAALHTAAIDSSSCLDIATLGVRRGLRAQGIYASAALYHGLFRLTRANNIRSVVSVLDDRVRDLLDVVSLPLGPIPGAWAAPYLGSTSSTPVFGHCGPMIDRQRRINPEAHRLISWGEGLQGIDLPPLEHYRLVADVDLRHPTPASSRPSDDGPTVARPA